MRKELREENKWGQGGIQCLLCYAGDFKEGREWKKEKKKCERKNLRERV